MVWAVGIFPPVFFVLGVCLFVFVVLVFVFFSCPGINGIKFRFTASLKCQGMQDLGTAVLSAGRLVLSNSSSSFV